MSKRSKYIYKYVKYDDALAILDDNSVSLGNPLRFNDPFDCFIGVDESNKTKSMELLNEFFYITKFIQLLDTHEIDNSKYQSAEKIIDTIRHEIVKSREFKGNQKLYKTALSAINEICSKDSTFLETLTKEKNDFVKTQEKRLYGFRESVLVSCFCERYDSILMWGHYADRDRGVCIEYENPNNENFYSVKYQNKRIPFNLYKITCRVLGYLFTNDVIDEADDVLIKNIIEPFLTKSVDWKYEYEIRCIFSKNVKNDDIYQIDRPYKPDGVQYLYRMPTKVTKIFLGCKINKERVEHITKVAKEKNIPVIKMRTNNGFYRLDPIPLDTKNKEENYE